MRTIQKPQEGEYAPYTIIYYDLLPDDGRVLEHMLEDLEQLARSKGWHRLCKIVRYACLFDRPERALGASGG
jgi:hypothetical protein